MSCRGGCKKGLSRRHLEDRNTCFREYDPLRVRPILREAKPGGVQTRDFSTCFRKGPDCVTDPFRNVPCRCSHRPRKKKRTNRDNPEKSGNPEKIAREKPPKDRESPQKGPKKDKSGRMRLFCLPLEAPCLRFFTTVDTFSFFTYSWSFFAYSFSFFTYSWSFFTYSGKVRLIRALTDCKQRSLTVSKKAPTVSKKASPSRDGRRTSPSLEASHLNPPCLATLQNWKTDFYTVVVLMLWRILLQNFQPQRQWCIKILLPWPRNVRHHWCWGGGESVRGDFSLQRWWCIKSCLRKLSVSYTVSHMLHYSGPLRSRLSSTAACTRAWPFCDTACITISRSWRKSPSNFLLRKATPTGGGGASNHRPALRISIFDSGSGWGVAKRIAWIGGGGKRTAECALQNHFWRPQKLGLVWSVPLSLKRNDRESPKKGGGKRIVGWGSKNVFGEGCFAEFTVCSQWQQKFSTI